MSNLIDHFNDCRDGDIRLPPGSGPIAPLGVDPWVASSLLQKAIRRGDADLAERAAVTLHRQRGKGIWRWLLLISFEDIGVASPAALVEAAVAATNSKWRDEGGGEARALRILARRLADAAKDRSADYLICARAATPTSRRHGRRARRCRSLSVSMSSRTRP